MKINKKHSNIAKNYAIALFDIAQNKNEQIYKELCSVVEILHNSKDLKTFLENPLISTNDKKEIIYKVFGKDFDLQIINLLNTLADNKRLDLIETVCYNFEIIYEKSKNILKANIFSAIEMNEESKKRLLSILERKLNCTIIPKYEIKEEVIGGLIIKIQDKIIDLSLQSKIKDIRKILI